jgi:hypothetical protein
VCSLFSVAPQAKHGAPSMFLTASPGLEDFEDAHHRKARIPKQKPELEKQKSG